MQQFRNDKYSIDMTSLLTSVSGGLKEQIDINYVQQTKNKKPCHRSKMIQIHLIVVLLLQ